MPLRPASPQTTFFAAADASPHPIRVKIERDVVDVFWARKRARCSRCSRSPKNGVFSAPIDWAAILVSHRAHQPFAGHETNDNAFAVLDDEGRDQHRGPARSAPPAGSLARQADDFAGAARNRIRRRHRTRAPSGWRCPGRRQTGTSRPTIIALMTVESRPNRASRTCHHPLANRMCMSSLTPMVTKKSPISTSRKGLDVLLHLELVFRFRNQHPGDEAPRARTGRPVLVIVRRLSVMSSTLRDEHFRRLGTGHDVNHLRIRRWPKRIRARHRHRLGQRDGEQHGQHLRWLGQRRNDDQQGDDDWQRSWKSSTPISPAVR